MKSKRKGALAAYRDATLFKVIYGWGLRRTETSKLDVVDFGRNPKARQFGRYGTLNVRYGKAKKGQPPRRRNVLSVMDWAVEAVADYVENVRPRFGFSDHPTIPRWEQLAATSAMATTLLLLLDSRGWGGVWFGGPHPDVPQVRKHLGIGDGEQLLGYLYVGTPVPGQTPRPRSAADIRSKLSWLDDTAP
ncbi:nitroreductase family protein [Streptomyces brevispora]|uniref:nitroreductase family protein n=1 Tax=Streptomyces brevispora TaxID=887462 RepID=UPI00381DEC4A